MDDNSLLVILKIHRDAQTTTAITISLSLYVCVCVCLAVFNRLCVWKISICVCLCRLVQFSNMLWYKFCVACLSVCLSACRPVVRWVNNVRVIEMRWEEKSAFMQVSISLKALPLLLTIYLCMKMKIFYLAFWQFWNLQCDVYMCRGVINVRLYKKF